MNRVGEPLTAEHDEGHGIRQYTDSYQIVFLLDRLDSDKEGIKQYQRTYDPIYDWNED